MASSNSSLAGSSEFPTSSPSSTVTSSMSLLLESPRPSESNFSGSYTSYSAFSLTSDGFTKSLSSVDGVFFNSPAPTSLSNRVTSDVYTSSTSFSNYSSFISSEITPTSSAVISSAEPSLPSTITELIIQSVVFSSAQPLLSSSLPLYSSFSSSSTSSFSSVNPSSTTVNLTQSSFSTTLSSSSSLFTSPLKLSPTISSTDMQGSRPSTSTSMSSADAFGVQNAVLSSPSVKNQTTSIILSRPPYPSISRLSSVAVQPLRLGPVSAVYGTASYTTVTETTVISHRTTKIVVTIGPSGTLSPLEPSSRNLSHHSAVVAGTTVGAVLGIGIIAFGIVLALRFRRRARQRNLLEDANESFSEPGSSMRQRQRSYRSDHRAMSDENNVVGVDTSGRSFSADVSRRCNVSLSSNTLEDRLGLSGEGFSDENGHNNSIFHTRSISGEDPFSDVFAVNTATPATTAPYQSSTFSRQSRCRSASLPSQPSSGMSPLPAITRTATGFFATDTSIVLDHVSTGRRLATMPRRQLRDRDARHLHLSVGTLPSSALNPSFSSVQPYYQGAIKNNSSSEESSPIAVNSDNDAIYMSRDAISRPIVFTRTPSTLLKPASIHVHTSTFDSNFLLPSTSFSRSSSPSPVDNAAEGIAKNLLDEGLIMRLRGTCVASTGSIGLADHEDYSRPIVGDRQESFTSALQN